LRWKSQAESKRLGNPSVSGPDQGGLPSETLKSGSLEGGQSADRAKRTVSRVSSPWLIAQMCRFKFSPERQPWSFGHISPITVGLRGWVTFQSRVVVGPG
jgi:hypothetical protein